MKKLLGLALTLTLSIVVASPVRAADGDLDVTFGSGGIVITGFGGGYDFANALALQSDGKIVAAGETRSGLSGPRNFALARYNIDGSLDTTFGGGGKVTTAISGGAASVALQSDGKILAAGGTTTGFALVRYNIDGSLDSTFGSGGKVVQTGFSGFSIGLVLQPDGKIVVSGARSGDFALARYNGDGSPDPT